MSLWRRLAVVPLLLAACTAERADGGLQVVEFQLPAGGLVAGSAHAPVVIVEFGSHACEVCRRMVDSTLPAIQSRFVDPRRAQYRFVEAGVLGADPLSEAFECLAATQELLAARAQLNRLFEHHLDSLAALVRAPPCRPGADARRRRNAERAVASRLGVPGTPTFVVGRWYPPGRVVGRVLVGYQRADSLQQVVQRAIERVGD